MIAGETDLPSDDCRKPITVHSGHKTPGVMRPLEGEEDEASGPSDVKGGCLPKQREQQINPEANATKRKRKEKKKRRIKRRRRRRTTAIRKWRNQKPRRTIGEFYRHWVGCIHTTRVQDG